MHIKGQITQSDTGYCTTSNTTKSGITFGKCLLHTEKLCRTNCTAAANCVSG